MKTHHLCHTSLTRCDSVATLLQDIVALLAISDPLRAGAVTLW